MPRHEAHPRPARRHDPVPARPGSQEAFQWMCKKANGGDFLVIRATGTGAYNPYISALCAAAGYPANSVATLIIPSKAAANYEPVVARIREAEAAWIAGGDQSNYVNYWKGTPLSAALQARIDAGMPIGGTSAGMAVLTQFIYSAQGAKGITPARRSRIPTTATSRSTASAATWRSSAAFT